MCFFLVFVEQYKVVQNFEVEGQQYMFLKMIENQNSEFIVNVFAAFVDACLLTKHFIWDKYIFWKISHHFMVTHWIVLTQGYKAKCQT